MKIEELIRKTEGVQTMSSIMALLKVNKKKATYLVYRLRKQGYVKTKRLKEGIRVYDIAFENKLKGFSYYEMINKISPIKISAPSIYRVYGKQPTYEEVLIFAIKTKSLRTILAALVLFKKIDNWTELYHLGKINHIERQIGALYDLTRKIVRTRRMSKQFRNNALPKRKYPYAFLVDGIKSKDFKKIEKQWRIHIPFNKTDLRVYR